jgi:hypothetical protein
MTSNASRACSTGGDAVAGPLGALADDLDDPARLGLDLRDQRRDLGRGALHRLVRARLKRLAI